jgi:hypothetical protein
LGRALLGLFLAELSGSVTGHAYMEVRETSTVGVFTITTIEGAGFTVTISDGGAITIVGMHNELAAASGTGSVLGTASFTLNATVTASASFPNGAVQIAASRVPGTDPSFPLNVEGSEGDPVLTQVYLGTVTTRNPVTGGEFTLTDQQIFVDATGSTANIRFLSGDEYAGPFYEPLQGAIRVVPAGAGEFATIAGSSTNTGNDVVGRMDFLGVSNITALIAVQTRGTLGTQTQQVITVNAAF